MPTVQEVWKDPDFLRLPPPEKTKVMQAIDTDFASLPSVEQNKVIMQLGRQGRPAEASRPPTIPQQQAIDEMGAGKKLLTGIGAGMYDAYKGVQQAGATLGNKVGLVDDSTVQRITQEGEDARRDFAPLKQQSKAASAGNFIGKTVPYLTVPGGVAGGAISRAGTSALAGGLMGATEFVPEGESRLANTGLGALSGGVASAGLSGLGKLYNTFATDATKALPTQQLADKFNIPVTLSEAKGQGSKLDTLMERVPSILGIRGFREKQAAAAKDAATTHFSKYVTDPNQSTTAAMKDVNDKYIDSLYQKVKQSTQSLPSGAAPEVKKAATELLDRYPTIFESIQDTKLKGILKNIIEDTSTKNKTIDVMDELGNHRTIAGTSGGHAKPLAVTVLDASGKPIMKQVQAKVSFDDLWTLRKAIGAAKGTAVKQGNDEAASQFSRIYASVSNDMDNMLKQAGGPAINEFKAANEAFKQYSLKFDVMREAYDKAMGTIGAGTAGFFSPQKYGTALKNLANDPKNKPNIKWSPGEIDEMTGLANILQVTKRAGQYLENPPTGNRWGEIVTGGTVGTGAYAAGGLAATAKTAGGAAAAALVTKFITTTPLGKRLALSASKLSPTGQGMRMITEQIYKQLPKFAAEAGISLSDQGAAQ